MERQIINQGNIIEFKKNHPCGSNKWNVLKTGLDYKLECVKCKRVIIISRLDLYKRLKKVIIEGE